MEDTRNIAPMKLELLLAVVHNDKARYYSSLIQSHQANLQLSVPAKGTTHLILGKGYKGIAFTIPMTSVIGTLAYGFLSNDKRTVKEKD